MRFPVGASSLSEFWGRRWNLAFRDLAHRLVFAPVTRRWGHQAALWASFAASGLAHELVISVPAGAGFGLPTAYFLLQALGITLERKADTPVRHQAGSDGSARASFLRRWLRTHAFTLLPAFILFHPPFVERVMVPFFRVIGALP
jgi:alginate O-acetyltransferase complex protein AlgI